MSTRPSSTAKSGPDNCAHQVTGVALGGPRPNGWRPLLKALSDPTRLQLLAMIEASPAGEACVYDLTAPLDLSQPTISHHLKILVNPAS